MSPPNVGSATTGRRSRPELAPFPEVYRRLSREYPDAKCALRFTTPHEMLFATIMSAQCTDVMVNKVTEKLFVKYRTLEDYAEADIAELEADIRSTGFFRQKSRNIKAAATKILEEFGGTVPDTMEELISIPGAARKTANIVLGNAFGKVVGIAVDTHVRRLSQRLGLTQNEAPDKIEQDLMKIIPKSKWFRTSYLFIEHGRAICKAPKPRCADCVLSNLCPSSTV